MRILSVLIAMIGGPLWADNAAQVHAAAVASFDRMPVLRRVGQIAGECGADESVNNDVVYCAANNIAYLTRDAAMQAEAGYLVAHVLGHATQIRHGVADVALATIQARRAEEVALRHDVTRQVECLAGVFYARAGLPAASLTDWFSTEPFTDSHWGRNPLTVGPKVTLGLAQRDAWFRKGQAATEPSVCATADFDAQLLIAAFQC